MPALEASALSAESDIQMEAIGMAMIPVKIFIMGLAALSYDYTSGDLTLVVPNETKAQHRALVAWQIDDDANYPAFNAIQLGGVSLALSGAGLEKGAPRLPIKKAADWPCMSSLTNQFPVDYSDARALKWIARPGCWDPSLRSIKPWLLSTSDPTLVAGRMSFGGLAFDVSGASVGDLKGEMAGLVLATSGATLKIVGINALSDVLVVEVENKLSETVYLELKTLDNGYTITKIPLPVVDGETRLLVGNVPSPPYCLDFNKECLDEFNMHFMIEQELSNGATRIQAVGWLKKSGTGIDDPLNKKLFYLDEKAPTAGGAHRPICLVTWYDQN